MEATVLGLVRDALATIDRYQLQLHRPAALLPRLQNSTQSHGLEITCLPRHLHTQTTTAPGLVRPLQARPITHPTVPTLHQRSLLDATLPLVLEVIISPASHHHHHHHQNRQHLALVVSEQQ
jgi:hypothetical protein